MSKIISLQLILFSLFSITSIHCSNDENAFYAISSLQGHLEQEFDSQNEHYIHFNESDLEKLWERTQHSEVNCFIEKAKSHYASANLKKAKKYLDKAWEQLNPLFTIPVAKKQRAHPYILPEKHLTKSALDDIFTKSFALKDAVTFKEAGFKKICQRPSKMVVAKHALMPGYLVKAMLESDKGIPTWKWLVNRCKGAENIRNLIQLKGLKYFTVSDKWIYPIGGVPEEVRFDSDLSKYDTPALLVVKNMNIVSEEDSKRAWKEKITHEHLEELYCILSHGFASCYLAQNIPYTHDGHFACVDTEYPQRVHRYQHIFHYLSDEMKTYWEHLVRTGGPFWKTDK